MPTKKRRQSRPAAALAEIAPLLKPVVAPVLSQLDRHAEMLEEIREAMQVQFKRTAQIQAQLDKLMASLAKKPRKG